MEEEQIQVKKRRGRWWLDTDDGQSKFCENNQLCNLF